MCPLAWPGNVLVKKPTRYDVNLGINQNLLKNLIQQPINSHVVSKSRAHNVIICLKPHK